MTTDAPEPIQRQLDVNDMLQDYQQQLAASNHGLVIARAGLRAAEAECAQLRLQVVALQEQLDAITS